MEEAMAILKQFSEKEQDYDRYMLRLEYLREQMTLKEDNEIAKAKLEQSQKDLEQSENKLVQSENKLDLSEKKLVQIKQSLSEKDQIITENQLELEKLKQQLKNKTNGSNSTDL